MRIIAVSDSHRNFDALERVFRRNPDADMFIFLGDGERDIEYVASLYPEKQVLAVCGNCDYNSTLPPVRTVSVGDRKILFLHGHSHGVKYSHDGILKLGKENGASVVLFGHTHQRFYRYEDGIHILNPGSVSLPRDGKKPSYAFVDITPAGIVCNHVDV
ncbi:MAG: metallophosphoesterase [Oscillospiraceae bacterium]